MRRRDLQCGQCTGLLHFLVFCALLLSASIAKGPGYVALFLWHAITFCVGLVTYFVLIFAVLGGLRELNEGVKRRMQQVQDQLFSSVKDENPIAQFLFPIFMIPVLGILLAIMFPVFLIKT